MAFYKGRVKNQDEGIGILGLGMCVPEKVMSNNDFNIEGITSAKVERVIGIKERRVAHVGEAVSDLCVGAAMQALQDSGMTPDDIDMIIVGTATPDFRTPPAASVVQKKLGIEGRPAFDVNSGGCANSIFTLINGIQFLQNNTDKNILVIVADVFKGHIDYTERTSLYFGDGASAFILGKVEKGNGFMSYNFKTISEPSDALKISDGGSHTPITETTIEKGGQYLKMDGRAVWDFATANFPHTVRELLCASDLKAEDIDFLVSHQANINIITKSMKDLGIPMSKTYTTIERFGNTSGASVGITLAEAYNKNLIKKGDLVVLVGFGAGLGVGSILLKF